MRTLSQVVNSMQGWLFGSRCQEQAGSNPDPLGWEAFKTELLANAELTVGLDGSDYPRRHFVIETLLDNARKSIVYLPLGGNLDRIVFNCIANMNRHLIAYELVGVQPLTGPVGTIHTLRTINQAALDSAQMTHRRPSSTKVINEIVQCIQSPPYSFNQGRLELASPKFPLLAAAECNDRLLNDLNNLIGLPAAVYDQAIQQTFIADVHRMLAHMIKRESLSIANRSRRGPGNWCVLSPIALAVLQSAQVIDNKPLHSETGFSYAGVIDGVRVFVHHTAVNDDVMVGYKLSDIDAGAFYAPYLLFMPNTYEAHGQEMTFYHRGGFHVMRSTDNSSVRGGDYFGKIGLVKESLSFV